MFEECFERLSRRKRKVELLVLFDHRGKNRVDLQLFLSVWSRFECSVVQARDAVVCFNLICRRELKAWINKDLRIVLSVLIWSIKFWWY